MVKLAGMRFFGWVKSLGLGIGKYISLRTDPQFL